jgi:dipeptidyl aminopeptidase/acylaminoacyl peptidase
MIKRFLVLLLLPVYGSLCAQDDATYQTPPKDITDLVLAPPTPGVSIDKKGEWMLFLERSDFATIAELAEPELRIAGLRINPDNFGPSRSSHTIGFKLKHIPTSKEFQVSGLPQNLRASSIQWSPDQKQIAFTHTEEDKITLWKIDVANKSATKVSDDAINSVLGTPYYWSNNEVIVYKAAVGKASSAPKKPKAPSGPVIQESLGKAAASRTYQDLIKNPYDEALFEFYATSTLKSTDGKVIGAPDIYSSVNPSPDNNYILIEKIKKPFSYLVPAGGFPESVDIVDRDGKLVKHLQDKPSTETAPIGFDAVVDYPRSHNWRNDEPATLYYVQALDKGNPKTKVEFRDAVYVLTAPFDGQAKELARTRMRYRGITWGTPTLAILNEGLQSSRQVRMNILNPSTGKVDSLYQRRTDDAYADLGFPVTVPNQWDQNVLLVNNNQLLLRSQGASPDGDLPLLQTLDLKTKKTKLIWRCEAPYYENIVSLVDPKNLIVITSRESITETPNYYLRDLKKKRMNAITEFKDPQPVLREVYKEKISYKRQDGIDLTATLYLPKGYDKAKDGPLPVIMWAYPREFKSAADAAQVRGSKYTFTRINYGSPVYWVTQGYAVLDNAEMPIVGEGEKKPNDNFIEQLKWNAEAAINKVAELGIGDRNRVAVGGHSYGAFMTANLLAHTNLFKAGIARSGAYNRSLTPFGFQNEDRTYWDAPELYNEMSPFTYAHKIKSPLLMIHGEADNNSGTFPIQSERLYNAIKGNGGTVRFVLLPYESHGYAAKENILHMLWEQNAWMEKFVKGDKKTASNPGVEKPTKAF